MSSPRSDAETEGEPVPAAPQTPAPPLLALPSPLLLTVPLPVAQELKVKVARSDGEAHTVPVAPPAGLPVAQPLLLAVLVPPIREGELVTKFDALRDGAAAEGEGVNECRVAVTAPEALPLVPLEQPL